MKQKILERLRCDKKFRKKMILFAGILLLLLLTCLYTLVKACRIQGKLCI